MKRIVPLGLLIVTAIFADQIHQYDQAFEKMNANARSVEQIDAQKNTQKAAQISETLNRVPSTPALAPMQEVTIHKEPETPLAVTDPVNTPNPDPVNLVEQNKPN